MKYLTVAVLGLLISLDSRADAFHRGKYGVYEGAGCKGVNSILKSFIPWSGHDPERAIDFLPVDNWTKLTDTSWYTGCWAGHTQDVIYSVPMLPKGVPTVNSLTPMQQGAGNFDKHFVTLANNLVKGGAGNAVIRLGWEFNGSWYPWYAEKDPESYVAYFRHIVTAMRSVPSQHFEFDWCANLGWDVHDPKTFYPGDAYVDIVGLDVYNNSWGVPATNNTPKSRWNSFSTSTFGLNWQKAFAAAHKKQVSFPEWGTGTRPDGHGGGDDPFFIKNMIAWINAQPNLNYADYWDYPAPDYNAKLSDNHQPLSGVEFLQDYGPWSPTALAAAKAIAAKVQSNSN